MPYVTETAEGRRVSATVNLRAFATDLAAALGAQRVTTNESDWREYVAIGPDHLFITADVGRPKDKTRVQVSIEAADVPHERRNFYCREHKTESASVMPDARPIERIAADIKKRVIDASQGALAAQREHARKLDDTADDGTSASFYLNQDAGYIEATISGGDSVAFQRVGSTSLDKFIEIACLLLRKD